MNFGVGVTDNWKSLLYLLCDYLMSLQEIESVKITILVDNITDRLLPSSTLVKRPPFTSDERITKSPRAEHGFSALCEISYVDRDVKKINRFLFDTGVTEDGIIYNSDIFGINFQDIETIILSHGHFDHISGLISTIRRVKKPIEIIVHPDAFLKRWLVFPNGNKAKLDSIDEKAVQQSGGIIRKISHTSFFPGDKSHKEVNNRVLITGEIPRTTDFERGFPLQFKEGTNESDLIPDPLVNDDQAIVMKVKGKGLVILTGCGHAGIINTINFVKKVTGIEKIYALIGGFHLTGEGYEGLIPLTVDELKKANPTYIVPCHCSGWKAANEIIKVMPENYIQNSVGSTFFF
jgi:7,8-dihydropterin-6-yl-methyl-4-(beta-D-ribofuranosyl)aminobenzene 5'-phosphate synthase